VGSLLAGEKNGRKTGMKLTTAVSVAVKTNKNE
jgi:hypothetical protein